MCAKRSAGCATHSLLRIERAAAMWLKEYGKAKARVLRPLGFEPPRNTDPESNGEYRLLEWLASLPERKQYDGVVDVGANMGEWTAAAMARLKSAGLVRFLCVEPVPHFAQIVRDRFSANAEVACREVALSDAGGGAIEITSVGGGARIIENGKRPENGASGKAIATHRVALSTGDELVRAESLKPWLIKIDCDGHDFRALRGFSSTLENLRPVVQFEYSDFWAAQGMRLRAACKFLVGMGYATFKLFPERLERFRFNPFFETFGYQNIVAAPSEFPSFSGKSISLSRACRSHVPVAAMTKDVLFLQGRTHKAGAQTCLARLLRHDLLRQWNCRVLSSQPGWFTEECERLGVPVTLTEFPSSRSLAARLFGNEAFSKRVAAELQEKNFKPAVVFANDHQEGLLALSLTKRFGAKSAILLRSPGMRQEDYVKYRCGSFDHIRAIGDELTARVQAWEPAKKIIAAYDGVFEDEFLPLKEKLALAPSRILAIGSPLVWKGWADLVEALTMLEQQGVLPKLHVDFTGAMSATGDNDLKLSLLANVECNFLGRVERFRELVREYDLVINPSRMETFGMAAIEVLAAGVPLLSSRTGVMEDVQTNPAMLFEPATPASLAQALRHLLENWSEMDFGIAPAQRNIRQKFMIDHAAAALEEALKELAG